MIFNFFSKKKNQPKEKKDWFLEEKLGELTIDAYETDNEFVIYSAVGGITAKDLELSLEDHMLVIKGKRERPKDAKDQKKYFCQECFWGGFFKKLIVPQEIDITKAKATVKNGIFNLRIPKKKTPEEEVKIEIN